MAGGNMGPVVRRGDWVYRVSGEWSPSVHRLLRHCRAAGLTSVPEVRELTDDGHEVLATAAQSEDGTFGRVRLDLHGELVERAGGVHTADA